MIIYGETYLKNSCICPESCGVQGVVGRWLVVSNKAFWDIFLWCGEDALFFSFLSL